jgi:hypothetical protein
VTEGAAAVEGVEARQGMTPRHRRARNCQAVARLAAVAAFLAMTATARSYADTPAPAGDATPAQQAPVNQTKETPVQGASMEDYRRHLTALQALTAACAKARDRKSCDPASVGPDDRVQLGAGADSEQRMIRYAWLRELLRRAQDPDAVRHNDSTITTALQPKDATLPAPRTTTILLEEAEKRLANDFTQAGGQFEPAQEHPAESSAMQKVLAEREFRRLKGQDPRDSILEKINDWVNSLFMGVSQLAEGAAWLGQMLVWGFVLAVAAGLIWGLLQLERRWRVRLVPDDDGPALGAASARDWQLWIEDARRAAAAGQWREAIHFLYWAAISRLESKRLWPADRARTPREYLALVAPEDPRKDGLAALTGSFERTWYGGRQAGEAEYRQADALAAALIGAGSTGTGMASGGNAR